MMRISIASLSCFVAILLFSDLYAQRKDEDARSGLVALTVGFSDKIFYDVSVNDVRAITEIWTRTLIKRINETAEDPKAKAVVYHGLPSIVRALRAGEVDLLILLPLEHLEIGTQVPLEPILTAIPEETFTYEYILLSPFFG